MNRVIRQIMSSRLLPGILIAVALHMTHCGRKDVDRHGQIKMRGERSISMRGKDPGDRLQKGIASWYGHPFHGRQTANGERYDMNAWTAAHKSLPFGTWVRVKNLDNGRETRVRINDRGPFKKGRIIDLSRRAAEAIAMIGTGTARVALYLDQAPSSPDPQPQTVSTEEHNQECWYVQVGSFSTLDRARAIIYRLDDLGFQARVMKHRDLYRVRIGPHTSSEQSRSQCRQLKRLDIDCFTICDDG